jgi:hypothetical protein
MNPVPYDGNLPDTLRHLAVSMIPLGCVVVIVVVMFVRRWLSRRR